MGININNTFPTLRRLPEAIFSTVPAEVPPSKTSTPEPLRPFSVVRPPEAADVNQSEVGNRLIRVPLNSFKKNLLYRLHGVGRNVVALFRNKPGIKKKISKDFASVLIPWSRVVIEKKRKIYVNPQENELKLEDS